MSRTHKKAILDLIWNFIQLLFWTAVLVVCIADIMAEHAQVGPYEPVVITEQPYIVEPQRTDNPKLVCSEVVRTTLMLENIQLKARLRLMQEEEIRLLAHLIFAEAGSDWCSDLMQLYVGSVVLNRVKHELYPDSLYEVIYQNGQYSCVKSGMIDYEYNDRAYQCAKYLIENGSQLPDNVIFQAEFKQGDGVYHEEPIKDGRVMYFCYKGEKDGTGQEIDTGRSDESDE